MTVTKLSDNKVVAALVVALILWTVAKVSGVSELPAKFEQHEARLTHTEADTRAMREAQIEMRGDVKYIREIVDELRAARRQR